MKKNFIFLLITLFMISFQSYSQWSLKLSLNGMQIIQHLSASNDKIVWALTDKMNIFKTVNGGNNWFHYEANGISSNTTIEWIFAFDSSTGLLAANTNFTGHGPGLIYRTTDGGRNWVEVFSHIGNCDFTIGMKSKEEGLLAINESNVTGMTVQELYATANGGVTWSKKIITDPTSYYYIDDLFVKGKEAWLAAHDSLYYSRNLGISWSVQKLPANVGFSFMQFENINYGIANNGALIDLFVKRPPLKKWQDLQDPTGVGGAVSGLVLNGNECWLSEALDNLKNFYSNDSCKTFTAVTVDPQSAFLILQKSWKGNNTWGATNNKIYVYFPQANNISLEEKYVSLQKTEMLKGLK